MNEKKACALKYPAGSDAPFIAASSKGFLAERILQIAKENQIPVVEDSALADVLTVQEIGACVPEETWEALAKIFALVLKMEERQKS